MLISFKYDLQKDTENFLKSFKSVNNKNPTKLQERYMATVGEVESSKVSEFLLKEAIDIPEKLKRIELSWAKVETEVIKRMEELFGVSLSSDITVYLSTNSRCTYRIKENYFFVYMNSENVNRIIIHELMHFYTWYSFYKELIGKGISEENYNEIKESLTELINTDFQNIAGVNYDKGYPQHIEIRNKINLLRKEGNNVRDIVKSLY